MKNNLQSTRVVDYGSVETSSSNDKWTFAPKKMILTCGALAVVSVLLMSGVAVYIHETTDQVVLPPDMTKQYFRINKLATFPEAITMCQDAGGFLAKIENHIDQRKVDLICGSQQSCYIGMQRDANGKFKWLDGTQDPGLNYLWAQETLTSYPVSGVDVTAVYTKNRVYDSQHVARGLWRNCKPTERKFPVCQKKGSGGGSGSSSTGSGGATPTGGVTPSGGSTGSTASTSGILLGVVGGRIAKKSGHVEIAATGTCENTCQKAKMRAVRSAGGGSSATSVSACVAQGVSGYTDGTEKICYLTNGQNVAATTYSCLCAPKGTSPLWVNNLGTEGSCPRVCSKAGLQAVSTSAGNVCSPCGKLKLYSVGINKPGAVDACANYAVGESIDNKNMACLCAQ